MDSLENLRVLEGSEVFFRGLQHPTHQISFHTIQALACLKYERSETIYERSDT